MWARPIALFAMSNAFPLPFGSGSDETSNISLHGLHMRRGLVYRCFQSRSSKERASARSVVSCLLSVVLGGQKASLWRDVS